MQHNENMQIAKTMVQTNQQHETEIQIQENVNELEKALGGLHPVCFKQYQSVVLIIPHI